MNAFVYALLIWQRATQALNSTQTFDKNAWAIASQPFCSVDAIGSVAAPGNQSNSYGCPFLGVQTSIPLPSRPNARHRSRLSIAGSFCFWKSHLDRAVPQHPTLNQTSQHIIISSIAWSSPCTQTFVYLYRNNKNQKQKINIPASI